MKQIPNKKVVVITGGSGVLGRSIASSLASEGYRIAILGRDLSKAKTVSEDINSSGGETIAVKCDVLELGSIQRAHKEINDQLGPCGILINCAGGNHPKGTTSKPSFAKEDLVDPDIISFFDLDPTGVSHVLELNFLGTMLPSQVFAQDMIDKEGCTIINISSMSAFRPLTKIPAYSAAKAAASNLTQWLAVHFADIGIRVNAIAPGFFLTTQNRALLTNKDGSISERGKSILAHTPMRRFGDPEDLNGTVKWLCSDMSKFVTGVIIPVDGGFSAFGGV